MFDSSGSEEGKLIAPNTLLGEGQRYLLLRHLGSGGMGDVYLARDRSLDRDVALKVLRLPGDEAAKERGRFVSEARVLAKLRHRSLVPVFDLSLQEDPCFIVQEYLCGGDLETVLLESGPVGEEAVWSLAKDIASALEYLHSNRVIHRDIKAANVMFNARGRAFLTDFGLIRELDVTQVTEENTFVGTPMYLPPEVLLGSRHESPGDVFQFGLLLHFALTGKYRYGSIESFNDYLFAVNAGKLDEYVDDSLLSDHFAWLLSKLCQVDPSLRPGSGADLLSLVEKVESSGGLESSRREEAASRTKESPRQEAALGMADFQRRGASDQRRAASEHYGRRSGILILLGLGILALLYLIGKSEPPRVLKLSKVSRDFLIRRDGLSLAFPMGLRDRIPEGDELRWQISKHSSREILASGLCKVEKGYWRIDCSSLEAKSSDTLGLDVFRGEQPVAYLKFSLVEEVFTEAVKARFGANWMQLDWKLCGEAGLTLDYEFGGEKFKEPSLRGSFYREIEPKKVKDAVQWSLSHRGHVLAKGRGKVGVRELLRLKEKSIFPSIPVDSPQNNVSLQPFAHAGLLWYGFRSGLVASLALEEGLDGLEYSPFYCDYWFAKAKEPSQEIWLCLLEVLYDDTLVVARKRLGDCNIRLISRQYSKGSHEEAGKYEVVLEQNFDYKPLRIMAAGSSEGQFLAFEREDSVELFEREPGACAFRQLLSIPAQGLLALEMAEEHCFICVRKGSSLLLKRIGGNDEVEDVADLKRVDSVFGFQGKDLTLFVTAKEVLLLKEGRIRKFASSLPDSAHVLDIVPLEKSSHDRLLIAACTPMSYSIAVAKRLVLLPFSPSNGPAAKGPYFKATTTVNQLDELRFCGVCSHDGLLYSALGYQLFVMKDSAPFETELECFYISTLRRKAVCLNDYLLLPCKRGIVAGFALPGGGR